MSLVENERTKLTANWLNAVASGIVITGVVAPAIAVYLGVVGQSQANLFLLFTGEVVWRRRESPYICWHGARCGG